ncbi:hypothetical protein HK102_005192, partial [Quaeritorhiza haematococci]
FQTLLKLSPITMSSLSTSAIYSIKPYMQVLSQPQEYLVWKPEAEAYICSNGKDGGGDWADCLQSDYLSSAVFDGLKDEDKTRHKNLARTAADKLLMHIAPHIKAGIPIAQQASPDLGTS